MLRIRALFLPCIRRNVPILDASGWTLDHLCAGEWAAAQTGGGYSIVFPDLPGVTSWAPTLEDVAKNVREALEVTFDVAELHGMLMAGPSNYPEVGVIRLDGEQRPEADPANPLFSAAEAADRLGLSRRQLNAKAQRLGVGRKIGMQRVFTEAEIELVRPRPTRGRPRKVEPVVARSAPT